MSFAQCAQCISECLGPTETHKDLRCLKKQGQVQRGCLHVEEFPLNQPLLVKVCLASVLWALKVALQFASMARCRCVSLTA